ncbi:MAG: (E)-4-hydroxy-3-methylbut-2-enyl-diphosphate synthase [Opitutales bacterium]|nr:(E)-4-hydroxy-3-methylbut-2-enyl-diphosphate synthase [Opitutales bacterium]
MNSPELPSYCRSRFAPLRRMTMPVHVGSLIVGGNAPISVQSMTNTPTQDVKATVAQCIALAEAGCDIVRVTAQNIKAAEALGDIRKEFSLAGFAETPLVADIHFLPKAAMEALNHVEKVRINPGNFADSKKSQMRDYSDAEYNAEIERIHAVVTPFFKRCKELGRAVRIGTNHGSLSDRILNRYGDTPLGMCESAMEFLRIARDNGFADIVLSMKASNPKIALQAYRLISAMMAAEDFNLPLHLGVTEAGDGDDARIKSAIGISGLLNDGLGDTIRVSLTEDPVAEVPVGRQIAEKAHRLWASADVSKETPATINLFRYEKRPVDTMRPGGCKVGDLNPPRVILPLEMNVAAVDAVRATLAALKSKHSALEIEGIYLKEELAFDKEVIHQALEHLGDTAAFYVLKAQNWPMDALKGQKNVVLLRHPTSIEEAIELLQAMGPDTPVHALDMDPHLLPALSKELGEVPQGKVIFSTTLFNQGQTPIAAYRVLLDILKGIGSKAPLWIRQTKANAIDGCSYSDRLLEASALIGGVLCEGAGDFISVETMDTAEQALVLAYNILQGARARSSKTEYVACPSCGRTLFDLQTTTARIRERTGHLKGVTIAVMGCIVNGPGEMADADFGYVGGQPGKVNLYVGKQAVKFNIPSAEAVEELVNLIKAHDKWIEPKA